MANVKVNTRLRTGTDSSTGDPEFVVYADLYEDDLVYSRGGEVEGVGDTLDAAQRRFWRNLRERLKKKDQDDGQEG